MKSTASRTGGREPSSVNAGRLDEVAYFGDVPGLDGIPTLRALAGLEEKNEDLSSSGGSSRR